MAEKGNPALDALRHHVTGAVQRGEQEAITEQRRPDVYWQYMESINEQDLRASVYACELLAIVDERHGGIIGYAIGREHADEIVTALRMSEANNA
jgi:hypothetical protein